VSATERRKRRKRDNLHKDIEKVRKREKISGKRKKEIKKRGLAGRTPWGRDGVKGVKKERRDEIEEEGRGGGRKSKILRHEEEKKISKGRVYPRGSN
jgi:hypothetical protein